MSDKPTPEFKTKEQQLKQGPFVAPAAKPVDPVVDGQRTALENAQAEAASTN